MNASPPTRSRWPGRRPLLAGSALAGLALLPLADPAARSDHGPTAQVRRGHFVDAIIEPGTLTSSELRVYGSSVPGAPVKIVALVPEGVEVAPGTVLIRFDPTPFELLLAREEATLQQASAELARADEDLRLEALAAQADEAATRLKLTSAESTLLNETEGRGLVAVTEAQVQAAEAARQATRAREVRDDVAALLAQGYATRAEAERAEQDFQRAEDQQRLAARRLASLTEFERPAALDRGRADLDAARHDLLRGREAASARLAQRRAARQLAEKRVEEARARVATARDHLARTVVVSEGTGLVVYRDLFFGQDRRKPQLGDEVWSNQPVLAVPDATRLVVEARVREVDLSRIDARRRVVVAVDAYPDLRLEGEVALVGALAQEDAAGVKSFPVTVRLRHADPRLRPGMTARIEIVAGDVDEALMVPTQAVFAGPRGEAYCLVVDGRQARRVAVRVDADNGVDAVVTGDVREGDRVRLVDDGRSGEAK